MILKNDNRGASCWKENDREPFAWIDVNLDYRKQFRLSADAVILIQEETRPIKDLEMLAQLPPNLKSFEEAAYVTWQKKEKEKAPRGHGEEYKQIRKELKKQYQRAKNQTEKSIEYSEIMSKLTEYPIPVRIYAKLGDHRVMLATTRQSE